MNIFKLIGELVVIYILYKVIFDFIVPLYRASKQMKGKMNEMHEQMQKQQRAQAEQTRRFEEEKLRPQQTSRPAAEDYIDYEEIKN